MERLTVNKSKDDMNMVELAHNCCFSKDGKAMYRDYDTIIDAREFARNLIRARNLISSDDEVFTNDTAFDEFMSECLIIDPLNEIGLIALFYRNLWAQADLYERLRHYENSQEDGRLLEFPCAMGDTVYCIRQSWNGWNIDKKKFKIGMAEKNELANVIDEYAEYRKLGTVEQVKNQKHNLGVAYNMLGKYQAIGTPEECLGYKIRIQNTSKLHDCNDCGRKRLCAIAPEPGEYCRINCYLWEPEE